MWLISNYAKYKEKANLYKFGGAYSMIKMDGKRIRIFYSAGLECYSDRAGITLFKSETEKRCKEVFDAVLSFISDVNNKNKIFRFPEK